MRIMRSWLNYSTRYDALDQSERLARARASDDEQRPVGRIDGYLLLRIDVSMLSGMCRMG